MKRPLLIGLIVFLVIMAFAFIDYEVGRIATALGG